jgi:hypothetical protein
MKKSCGIGDSAPENYQEEVSFSNIRRARPLESIRGEGESEEEYYFSVNEDNINRQEESSFRRKPRIQGQSAEKRKRIDPESGNGRKQGSFESTTLRDDPYESLANSRAGKDNSSVFGN